MSPKTSLAHFVVGAPLAVFCAWRGALLLIPGTLGFCPLDLWLRSLGGHAGWSILPGPSHKAPGPVLSPYIFLPFLEESLL